MLEKRKNPFFKRSRCPFSNRMSDRLMTFMSPYLVDNSSSIAALSNKGTSGSWWLYSPFFWSPQAFCISLCLFPFLSLGYPWIEGGSLLPTSPSLKMWLNNVVCPRCQKIMFLHYGRYVRKTYGVGTDFPCGGNMSYVSYNHWFINSMGYLQGYWKSM